MRMESINETTFHESSDTNLINSVKKIVYTNVIETLDTNDRYLIITNENEHHPAYASGTSAIIDPSNSNSAEQSNPLMSLQDLCRVCANTNSHMVPIFQGEGVQHDLINKIVKYLPINVTENDTLPLQLCYNCAATLIAWHSLLEGCLDAEQKLLGIEKQIRINEQAEKSAVNEMSQEAVVESTACVENKIIENLEQGKEGDHEERQPPNEERYEYEKAHKTRVLTLTEDKKSEVKKHINSNNLKTRVCKSVTKNISINSSNKKNCKGKEKALTCHVCGKHFKIAGSFYYHVKHVHGGVKNHSCDFCSKSFAMKNTLDDHRRIHTGERPYVCDLCSKTFKAKASLYIHRKIHTNNYPYKCNYCKKSFRWRQQLLGHLTIHTGEKNHTCEFCGKSFGVKYDLTRHKRTHTTEKPFVCGHCGSSFGQKRYLVNHERIKHQ